MQSVAALASNTQVWFGISGAALLLFAFLADRSAKALGFVVVDSTENSTKQDFSLIDFAKLVLVLLPVLAVMYALKNSHFSWTIALIVSVSAYLWASGYRSKIRTLQRAGLSRFNNVVLLSLFTLAIASLSIALIMSAWGNHGAP